MSIGFGGGLAFGLAFYWFNSYKPDTPPRPVTLVERVLAVAFIVWFATGSIVSNAYEGFTRHHELDWPESARSILWLGYLAIAGVAFGVWLWRTRRDPDSPDHPTNRRVLPWPVIPAVVALIVVAGYVVSIPPELQRNNRVLLGMYTFYMIVAAGLLVYLRHRSGQMEAAKQP